MKKFFTSAMLLVAINAMAGTGQSGSERDHYVKALTKGPIERFTSDADCKKDDADCTGYQMVAGGEVTCKSETEDQNICYGRTYDQGKDLIGRDVWIVHSWKQYKIDGRWYNDTWSDGVAEVLQK